MFWKLPSWPGARAEEWLSKPCWAILRATVEVQLVEGSQDHKYFLELRFLELEC